MTRSAEARAGSGGAAARLRRVPAVVWWCAGVGAALCLVAGFFVAGEVRAYAEGHEFGERGEILRRHVFEGERPIGDVSAYRGRAEEECAEHGADEGAAASAKWLEGCVDGVLGR